MDYATNRKFFDLKHNKKVKILMCIGTPFVALGAAMLVISSIPGLGLRFLMWLCWYPLIVGVPILAVAFSLRVKESDMLDLVEKQKKEFFEEFEEKMDFPTDFSANSILLSGCDDTQEVGNLPPHKLKSGVYLYPVVTLTALYIKKDRLCAMTRRFSLIEEMQADESGEIRLSELDGAEVVSEGNNDSKKFSFRVMNGAEVLLSAPLFADDYNKDQFAENILHTKQRRSR